MNIEFTYLLGPLTGGIIGYFTNWLAIKMMFRPHLPKYIFGMKLPFTPGLIPKERGRIADAIATSISENLMNKEVLEKNLLSEELPKLEKAPSEQVIQGIMRLIRKPTIPEASEGVYDDAVKYLKSICRY